MIKILIADDHAIVREGLKQIVAEESDMRVTGEAANASELFELLNKDSWEIVVLDINMPGKSGLEALKEMKTRNIKVPVLILSMFSEDQYGLRAIKAGAAGYLKRSVLGSRKSSRTRPSPAKGNPSTTTTGTPAAFNIRSPAAAAS